MERPRSNPNSMLRGRIKKRFAIEIKIRAIKLHSNKTVLKKYLMNAGRRWEEIRKKKAEPVSVTGYCNTRDVKNVAQKVCNESQQNKTRSYEWYDSTYAQWNYASGMGCYVIFRESNRFFFSTYYDDDSNTNNICTPKWRKLFSTVFDPIKPSSHTLDAIHVQNSIVSYMKHMNSHVNSCQYFVVSSVDTINV